MNYDFCVWLESCCYFYPSIKNVITYLTKIHTAELTAEVTILGVRYRTAWRFGVGLLNTVNSKGNTTFDDSVKLYGNVVPRGVLSNQSITDLWTWGPVNLLLHEAREGCFREVVCASFKQPQRTVI